VLVFCTVALLHEEERTKLFPVHGTLVPARRTRSIKKQVFSMEQKNPTILIVGGANTGRSPITVALLRQILDRHGFQWQVESAGVTGHDEEYADIEACSAMNVLNLDITNHQARSLTNDLIHRATILLALDSGIAYVLQNLYPFASEKITTLGLLAGRQRDIPDPFRMHVATWISYAKEINALLNEGFVRLTHLVAARMALDSSSQDNDLPPVSTSKDMLSETHAQEPTNSLEIRDEDVASQTIDENRLSPEQVRVRKEYVERCTRLLTVIRDMPALIEWTGASQQIQRDIQTVSTMTLQPDDLIYPYANLILALFGLATNIPDVNQLDALIGYIARMDAIVNQQAITQLSTFITQYTQNLH
jgi:protein-tyrosine phosphatase